MYKFSISSIPLKLYLPLFFLLCLSGNPLFTSGWYSKALLITYTFIFAGYIIYLTHWELENKLLEGLTYIVLFIFTLVIVQKISLGYVSYPGVLSTILKIFLGALTFLYYQQNKIDFFDLYIRLLSLLAKISIPLWLINQIFFLGIQLPNSHQKSAIFYTFLKISPLKDIGRNPGMFWEPGAFAGYLILAILFIILENRQFIIGSYKKETFWISAALITTMSTTGYLILGLIIFIYALQNYKWGKIIIIPLFIIIGWWSFNELHFLKNKIESQIISAEKMTENDVSNSRFGALKMDLQYIKSQPLTGNGLSIKTRFRFHPWIKEDIGHGNGMSNFLAYWGIPFFLFWLYSLYIFAFRMSEVKSIAIFFVILMLLVLQGEQFLNYPMFLAFFILPYFNLKIDRWKHKNFFLRQIN